MVRAVTLSPGMLGVISYPPIPIWDIGPFQFSLHGVFAAVGFIVGALVVTRYVGNRGFDVVAFQSTLTWALVGALLGARYLTSPAAIISGVPLGDALNPIQGNFSIMGGFVGGIVAGLWRARQLGLSWLPMLDMASFGLALGTVVGRIGDLAIVEHLGRATTLPFGYGIRPGYDVAPQHDALECTVAEAGADGLCGVYHHAAAYDLVGAAVLLGVLYLIQRRSRLRYGQLFSIWVIWYGFQRFLLDGLRVGMGDAELIDGVITWNQVSGLAGGVFGIFLFWYLGRRQPEVTPEGDVERGADPERVLTTEGT